MIDEAAAGVDGTPVATIDEGRLGSAERLRAALGALALGERGLEIAVSPTAVGSTFSTVMSTVSVLEAPSSSVTV